MDIVEFFPGKEVNQAQKQKPLSLSANIADTKDKP